MTTVRAAAWLSLSQRYVAFVVQLLSSAVLSRLLTPEEVGVFSLAIAVVALAQLLRDFGIGEYLLQRDSVSRDDLRSVFGASLLLAWTIAIVLLFAAAPISRYYDAPLIRDILHVLCINFLLVPLGSPAVAMMTRELAFGQLFVVQVGASLAGAVAAIGLALRGFGAMSLAWSAVTATLVTVVLTMALRPRETLLLPRLKNILPIGRFGGALTVGRVFDQVARRGPDLMIAGQLGMASLGIYGKACSLIDAFHDFFASAIGRVAAPAFARERRAESDLGAIYLQATERLSIAPLAFFGFLALMAEPVVRLLFGLQWAAAVPLIQIGCIASMASAPWTLAPPLLIGLGKIRGVVTVQVAGGCVILAFALASVSHGLQALAVCLGAAGLLKLAVMHWALRDAIGVSSWALACTCRRSLAVVVPALASAVPGRMIADGSLGSAVGALCVGAVCALVVGALAARWVEHPILVEIDRVRSALTRRMERARSE